jgi:chromosomal replication initiator protein
MNPSASAYLRAAQMVTEGVGYTAAARAYGVDRAVLRRFRPRIIINVHPVDLRVPQKRERATDPKPMNERVRGIVGAVADAHGLTIADLIGDRRTRFIAHPRQEAMWMLRNLTNFTTPAIGRLMGGRDHTTVLHGAKAFEDRLRPWLDLMEAIARAA